MSNVPVVLIVGLIGCGKSTIIKLFSSRGAAVIKTDDLWNVFTYREVNRARLRAVFDQDVLHLGGSPNKELLRQIFFSSDPQKQEECRKKVKALKEEFGEEFNRFVREQIDQLSENPDVTMVVVESAMALNDGWATWLRPDHIVSLHCPAHVRLERVLGRDNRLDKEVCEAIMSMQPSDDEHLRMAQVHGAILLDSEQDLHGIAGNVLSVISRVSRKSDHGYTG